LKTLGHKFLNVKALYFGNQIPLYVNWLGVNRELNRSQPDFIYIDGWESPAFFMAARLARRQHKTVIFGYRSTLASHRFNNILVNRIRALVFTLADYIVTAGEASTQAVLAMGIAPEKIITLFNPVDVSWFDQFASSHRTPITPGHKFLYVGRLIELKNISALLQAFYSIRQGSDTLTIAGDGEQATELKELARTLKISDSVHFLGHKDQEELASVYATSNTLILPSTNEVWGLVVNEALACGLQAIVSDKCGVAEFIKPMPGAYICTTKSTDIAEAMKLARSEWKGYIESPQILEYTPERFADALGELTST